MKNEEIIKKLAEPFSASEVEWRIQGTDQNHARGLAVPYIDSRAIQRRLDDVVGCFGWKNEFRQWHENSQLCSIFILYTSEKGDSEWISKCDGAENSAIESVKGGLSDSFKRAAVLWGIGRYLYDFGKKWVDVEKKGESYVIKQGEYAVLDAFHDSEVQRLLKGQSTPRKESQGIQPDTGNSEKKNIQQPAVQAGNSKVNQQTQPNLSNNSNDNGTNILYLVKRRLVSTNAKGQSTQLEMVSLDDGSIVKAFLRGNDESVAEGIKLKNIKLVEKQGTNRNYNVLEAFEIAS